jgi:hypothetical protein
MQRAPLSDEDLERFVMRGFVRLAEAFPRAVALECQALLWDEIAKAAPGTRRDSPATWTRPVVRVQAPDKEPFRAATNTERIHAAFDQLIGAGRWGKKRWLGGTIPVRFPHPDPPGDDGWHIDGSFSRDDTYWVNLWSKGRALLTLYLLSDVGPTDAPTRIRVGSHLRVPHALETAGEVGMPFNAVVKLVGDLDDLPIEFATGAAGDVLLCHPFLVHAADRHRGTNPRFLAQPEVPAIGALVLHRPDGDYSLVEKAVRLGLGHGPS